METRNGFYIEMETDEMDVFKELVEPYRHDNKKCLFLTKEEIINKTKIVKRKRKIAKLIAEYDSGI